MVNREYWAERSTILEASMSESATSFINKDLFNLYENNFAELSKEIRVFYSRFSASKGISFSEAKKLLTSDELEEFKWNLRTYTKKAKENALTGAWAEELENASARQRISRLESMQIEIKQKMNELYSTEIEKSQTKLGSIYSDSFLKTSFDIEKSFGFGPKINGINDTALKKVLSKPWASDGSNFSDRIWGTHRAKLTGDLSSVISNSIIRGNGPREAIADISKRYAVGKSAAANLIQTETTYFVSKGQLDSYKELEVEKYEIIATLDTHTSSICRGLDGHTFALGDFNAGSTAPPFHSRCRSTTAPYFDDEFSDDLETRAARDENGRTISIPASMKYDDWLSEFVTN
jgi:SPP1 gp7 family putative phage head morphogenesis protein